MGNNIDVPTFFSMIFITFGEQVEEVMKKLMMFLIAAALVACNTHKKPKCNTCPKWDDKIEQPAE
jgi:hypothetical protein